MGGFNLEDNLRQATGQEPWEPMWDPPPPKRRPDWRLFKLGLVAFVALIGAALWLASH